MTGRGGWTRRLDKLQAALPDPPAGSPYWFDSFARLGYAFRVGDREPDYAAVIEAYGVLRPPYGDEAQRLHDHLCELVGRAADQTPPCSAAEFATLAAWLADHGDALPTVNGWKKDLDLGDGATTTLSDLTWRAGQGPTAAGSGKLAETIRTLRTRSADGAAPPPGGVPAPPAPGWPSSVVRDDGDGELCDPERPPSIGPPGGGTR